MKFEIGNVVQLNSGGPHMTVHAIGDFPMEGISPGLKCIWFVEGGNKKEDVFHPNAVTLVDDNAWRA